jgi:tetratricopeptide (TPR) repeat protein
MKFSKWFLAVACALLIAGLAFAKDAKKENEYPNATRQEPKVDMTANDQRDLDKANNLVADNKLADAQPLVEKVIANSKSKYAQSFAHQLLGQIYYEQDKSKQSIAEYQKALEVNGLQNTQHFQVMFMIAQLQIQNENYADALASLEQWEKATGKQTADELALKGNAYYRLEKYPQAIEAMKKAISMTDKPNDSWQQILMGSYYESNQYDAAAQVLQQQLAKNPSDKKVIDQLAQTYIQGDKPQQAIDLLAKAKSQGLITTSEDYVKLAKLYAMADKPKDAAATMKEGLSKGTIQPTFDNYKLQGDVCMQAEDDACAIEGYTKASPSAKDGNVDYQLGYLQFYANHSKEAVDTLNRAITRGGLRQEGEAYLLRGDAQNDLDQMAAAKADWQKAAGYPSTKTMAEQRLKAAAAGTKIKRAPPKKTGTSG